MKTQFGVATREQLAGKTGLQTLQAMIAGELPAPTISRTLGFTLVEVADGVAIFEGDASPELLNPAGGVHGGWALTFIDSATGCSAMTVLEAGVGFTSLETRANFVRPISGDSGRYRCEGRVLSRGRTIITTEAKMISLTTGKLVAHGTSTVMVLRM